MSLRRGCHRCSATLTHDWRDKLTSVQQGTTTTDILLDPLGRMVGKVKHTPSGDLARAYLHDGDQVVLEYVQAAGSFTWQPERRHLWVSSAKNDSVRLRWLNAARRRVWSAKTESARFGGLDGCRE